MRKLLQFSGLLLLLMAFLSSCNKEGVDPAAIFYGKWKTSYNDTIEFSRVGGKNMIRYDITMNPAMQNDALYEYTYRDNKLGIKNGLTGLYDFYVFQSFRWLEAGKSFEVQGVEWFPYISSTLTYFTFTRIP
jgi:hypothetical protein